MKKISLLLIAVCSLINVWADQANGIVYVVPGGTGTGESWTNALGDIQTAITQANVADAPKDVWVKAGEYTISTTISMADGVNMYGGFSGNETSTGQRAKTPNGKAWDFVNASVLKGNGCRVLHYLTATGPVNPTILDGFTLTDGNGVNTATLNGNGGAVVMRDNFIIQNCIVKNSFVANGAGGGINMTGGTINNCRILNNIQSTNANGGGGIYANPPANITITIKNSTIEGNSSDIRGGGLNVQGAGTTVCENLTIFNNIAAKDGNLLQGGAVYANSANNIFTNCLIYNNTGSNSFRAMGTIQNSTIVNNVGGVYYASATTNFSNNIVWGCVTTIGGDIATSVAGVASTSMVAKNNATYNPIAATLNWQTAGNILFSSNNSNGDVEIPLPDAVSSGPKVIKPTTFKGVAYADEEIADLQAANWNLKYDSPCLDRGLNIVEITSDIVGNSRPAGYPQAVARFDIGAYELPYYGVSWDENSASHGEILNTDYSPVVLSEVVAYPSGMSLSYTLTPDADYMVDRAYYKASTDGGITFTGADVVLTPGEGDVWSTGAITAPVKIFVTWKYTGSSTPFTKTNSLNILVGDKKVAIEGINPGEDICVYNVTGQLVYKTIADASLVSIPLNSGCFVIKAGNETAKVIVK